MVSNKESYLVEFYLEFKSILVIPNHVDKGTYLSGNPS